MALADCRVSVLSRYFGGAVAVAITVNLFRGVHPNTPIMKAATLIGFITIVLGMICLVLDLTNPLFFWRILVYYNPTSVMSIGVMALLFYIPLVFVLMCVALQQEITSVSWLKWLDPIISFFANSEWLWTGSFLSLRLRSVPTPAS